LYEGGNYLSEAKQDHGCMLVCCDCFYSDALAPGRFYKDEFVEKTAKICWTNLL